MAFVFTVTTKGQTVKNNFITQKDSILLVQFWQGFKKAINELNKIELSKYFSFPFYCSPCLDYSTIKDSMHLDNPPVTLKVTRKIFGESAYKLFFEIPARNKLTKNLWDQEFIFTPAINDQNKKDGFQFSFALVPPSKTSEGSQAFVYLKKRNGKLVIVSVDHIP